MLRILTALGLLTIMFGGSPVLAQDKPPAVIYKTPQCSCCKGYVSYLRKHGYQVTVKPTHNLSLIKRQHSVLKKFEGCHTTLIDGYVVEGHVPVGTLNKLLTERPKISGISLPGMPMGSPGMTGKKTEPFKIFELSKDKQKIYAVE